MNLVCGVNYIEHPEMQQLQNNLINPTPTFQKQKHMSPIFAEIQK